MNAGDEHRHAVGEGDWRERWTFEAWNEAGTFGAVAAITLVPAARHAWYWSAVVREHEPLLTLVDTDLRMPTTSLALRGEGLWADHVCETALEHWTVANEAFAVALDDPEDALGTQRGTLVPLGLDLEWESADDPFELPNGYRIDASVTGEILIADDSLSADLLGCWRHEWGDLRWPVAPAHEVRGLRAPLRIDRPEQPPLLVERVVDDAGWHEWLRPEPAP